MVRTKEEVIKLANEYAKVISKLFDDVEVRLFGSYHNGLANEHSDIDLAVISPDFAEMDYTLSLKLLGRLKSQVSDDLEVISITPEEFNDPEVGSIASSVAKNSELIYRFPKLEDLFNL